jgi:hypothetical protein
MTATSLAADLAGPILKTPNALTYTFVASGTIYAGAVVGFDATGVDWTICQADSDTVGSGAFGVALNGATTGGLVNVVVPGPIVKVTEGAGGTIDAGDLVMVSTAAGCVIPLTDSADIINGIGVALTDFAANGTGYIMLQVMTVHKGA